MGDVSLSMDLPDSPVRAGEGREQLRLRALKALSESTHTARSTDECLTLAARALENLGVDAWFFASSRVVARAGTRFEAPALESAIAQATRLGRRVVADDARAGTLFVFPIGSTAAFAVVGSEDDVAFHELVASMVRGAMTSAKAGVRAEALATAQEELETLSDCLAHDLRGPLRALDGFSRLLASEYAEKLDDHGRGYLKRVRAGTQRMGRLLDDLLGLSRIARLELKPEAVNLSAIARAVLNELEARDPERKVTSVVANDLAVRGDGRLFMILFENLLGNAWKFSSKNPEPRIEVGQARHDAETVFFVRDNGVGFDMAYAHKLFVPFQRLHAATEVPGTGVGLATAHRVVARHRGRIWAESAPEKGATFFFTLGEAR
jgi:signal transduction histidine kinase